VRRYPNKLNPGAASSGGPGNLAAPLHCASYTTVSGNSTKATFPARERARMGGYSGDGVQNTCRMSHQRGRNCRVTMSHHDASQRSTTDATVPSGLKVTAARPGMTMRGRHAMGYQNDRWYRTSTDRLLLLLLALLVTSNTVNAGSLTKAENCAKPSLSSLPVATKGFSHRAVEGRRRLRASWSPCNAFRHAVMNCSACGRKCNGSDGNGGWTLPAATVIFSSSVDTMRGAERHDGGAWLLFFS